MLREKENVKKRRRRDVFMDRETSGISGLNESLNDYCCHHNHLFYLV
jgi:hypothetical protein